MKNPDFKSFLFSILALTLALPIQSIAMSCKMAVKYDVIRMTTGQAARELYEKFYDVKSKEIPPDQEVDAVQMDLKEVSFYQGALKVRVARVIHDEFNLEDMTSSEPLYYAQIVVNRKGIQYTNQYGETYSGFKISDSFMAIALHTTHTPSGAKLMDDNGNDLSKSFKSNSKRDCESGVCTSGKYFVKWNNDTFQTDLILPFGSSEGQSASPPQINIINNTETFWGDVKKTMRWFFNS